MTDTALRTRNADGRNFYQTPCCGVNVGVLEDAVRVECPACGVTLYQLSESISVYAPQKSNVLKKRASAMSWKRIKCFMFHWRASVLEPYEWRCTICGERWEADT
jgi:predicted RNA-binding Zn-ribbon protein involved in translation (DUF1610 family)